MPSDPGLPDLSELNRRIQQTIEQTVDGIQQAVDGISRISVRLPAPAGPLISASPPPPIELETPVVDLLEEIAAQGRRQDDERRRQAEGAKDDAENRKAPIPDDVREHLAARLKAHQDMPWEEIVDSLRLGISARQFRRRTGITKRSIIDAIDRGEL